MVDLKELFSKTERALIFDNEIKTPYVRQLKYRIRKKIEYALYQILHAIIHPQIRSDDLLIEYLNTLKRILQAYGYDSYIPTINKMIAEITINNTIDKISNKNRKI